MRVSRIGVIVVKDWFVCFEQLTQIAIGLFNPPQSAFYKIRSAFTLGFEI